MGLYSSRGSFVVQSSAPAAPAQGDLWYDTTTDLLKAYDGATWKAEGTKALDEATSAHVTAGSVGQVIHMIRNGAISGATASSLLDKLGKQNITKGDTDHTHTNLTTKQTVKEFVANDDDIKIVIDCNALTQDTTVTIETKTDGANYRINDTAVFPTDFKGKNVIVNLTGMGLDQKVSLTSTVLEGASRNIPYNWVEVNRIT